MAGIDNLKPMVKGETRNPNGRPKKVENVLKEFFLSEYNIKLSSSQTNEIIKGILSKSRSELVELAKNEDLPFWVSMIAKKATRDYEKGSIHLLELLFDRVYGKPKETLESTITEKSIKITLNLNNPNGEQ